MHGQFLLAAMDEAQLGRGFCAPNPSVGAVAVKQGQIIARAWHRGAGTPHAEQLLIEQLPPNLSGVTLYVTLEPCNHHGRTPPCVDAIIQYGFESVVFGKCDPNPLVKKNNSPDLLRAHGVSVHHLPLPEIDAFYEGYVYWTQTGRPWVTAKMAQSLDGKIARVNGARTQLSNARCEAFTHQNRLIHDLILTTARTVNQDNPKLNARGSEGVRAKPVAIVDRDLSLNPDSAVFSTATHCLIFYDEALPAPSPIAGRTYYSTACQSGALDLHRVLEQLGAIGYHTVWLEAGGALFTAMHQARLVQRTHLYCVPQFLGVDAVPAYQSADCLMVDASVSWIPMDDNLMATFEWETSSCSRG